MFAAQNAWRLLQSFWKVKIDHAGMACEFVCRKSVQLRYTAPLLQTSPNYANHLFINYCKVILTTLKFAILSVTY